MQVSGLNGVVSDFLQKKVTIQIEGFDAPAVYYDLELKEGMASHQEFRFTWQADGNFLAGHEQQMETIADYRGKEILIGFRNTVGQETHRFTGIIEGLYLQDEDGAIPGYTVIGRSRSIVLDDIPQSRTYIREGLQHMLHTVASQAPSDLKIDLTPKHSGAIPYTTQYNETDFAFMQRMARRYGEWFYYDGTGLQFGKTRATDITLVNGANLRVFVPGASIAPGKVNLTGYDYQQAATFSEQWQRPQQNSTNFLSRTALDSAANVYGRQNRDYQYVAQARDSMELREMQQLFQQANEAKMATYAGHSDTPLPIGGRITIQKGKAIGEFIVIEAKHRSELKGHYTCAFTALPVDIAVPVHTDPFVVQGAESQRALVVANNDPQKMKRVKVQFYWGYESDWIPVVTPYGGNGRGIYILPEVGDEVSVDFEGGNVDQPIVRGAVYNGSQKNNYGTADNGLKVFHFRESKIIIDDAKGSIRTEDKAGTIIETDGNGNATVMASKNISLQAENIQLKAGKKVDIQAGDEIKTSSDYHKQQVNKKATLFGDELLFHTRSKLSMESAEVNLAGTEKLMAHSDRQATLNSKGDLFVRGEKGNKMYNQAEDYEKSPPPVEAKVVVQFRPHNNYQGEYGFDWIRNKDTKTPGDVDYKKNVGKYYIKDQKTKKDRKAGDGEITGGKATFKEEGFDGLANSHYTPSLIPWKKDKDGNTEKYYVPWLSLYKDQSVTLNLVIDVQEEPDSMLFKENEHFDISPSAITKGTKTITIKCKKAFDKDQIVEVEAITKNEDGTEDKKTAGKLQVLANKTTYKTKVVFVNVRTNITGAKKIDGLTPVQGSTEQTFLEKYLKQALIDADKQIPLVSLDLTADKSFNKDYVLSSHNAVNLYHSSRRSVIHSYLETEFNDQNSIYKDYYKVFFFGDNGGYIDKKGNYQGLNGAAQAIGSNNVVLFATHNTSTTTHELLHAMGLYHSFNSTGAPHGYKYRQTENIMDYSHQVGVDRISTWKWQWGVLRSNTQKLEKLTTPEEALNDIATKPVQSLPQKKPKENNLDKETAEIRLSR